MWNFFNTNRVRTNSIIRMIFIIQINSRLRSIIRSGCLSIAIVLVVVAVVYVQSCCCHMVFCIRSTDVICRIVVAEIDAVVAVVVDVVIVAHVMLV